MVELILPIPKTCRYCGNEVVFTSNAEIYGKEYGNGKCFLCRNCMAYVGVHTETLTPLGTLANDELRKARNKAHEQFDKLWKSKKMKRNEAYSWLAKKMNLKKEDTHIALFEIEQCEKVVEIVKEFEGR
jgi:hypothetical protein